MKTLAALSLVAALLVGASSAHAQMKIAARAGAWTAYVGINADGKPMCRMTSTSDIRNVHVKWASGNLFIHLVKDNWKIPVHTEMPLAIQFDEEAPFEGTAKSTLGGAHVIEFVVRETADARRFIDQFATADRMRIKFGGNEHDWVMRMDGSDTIARRFTNCVAAVKKKMGPATQPFETEAPKHKQRPSTDEW